MKSKQTKTADLAVLRTEFASSPTAFVVAFEGLSVVVVDDLRRKLRDAGGSYRVVKNTLARRAAEGTSIGPVSAHFRGSTAVVGAPDVARVAKVLADFSKTHPALVVKGGVFEGAALNAAECKDIANLPSREELLSKLLFLLQSPMQRLATVLSANQRNLAVVLGQVAEKKEQ